MQKSDENAGQVQLFGPLKAGDVVLKAGNEKIGKGEPVRGPLGLGGHWLGAAEPG